MWLHWILNWTTVVHCKRLTYHKKCWDKRNRKQKRFRYSVFCECNLCICRDVTQVRRCLSLWYMRLGNLSRINEISTIHRQRQVFRFIHHCNHIPPIPPHENSTCTLNVNVMRRLEFSAFVWRPSWFFCQIGHTSLSYFLSCFLTFFCELLQTA